MPRNKLFIQYDLCFGCHACEVACQQENELPAGLKWLSVKQVGPKHVNGKLVMDFIPMTCMHCAKPPCMDVCPVEAITKGTDGIVRISRDLCIGCGVCLQACPFGAPRFNPDTDVVEKCNLCADRVEKGFLPACVQACPAGAILFGESTAITQKISQQRAVFLAIRWRGSHDSA